MLEGKTVDAAEPPRIVFESPTQCRESDHAEELLRRALSPSRAPGRGWSVAMRVDRAETPGTKGLRAQGEITDGDGVTVAHRSIAGTTADCAGLARAVGVWASLVLDSELRKASAEAPSGGAPAADGTETHEIGMGAAPAEPVAAWPAPAITEKASPEHDWYLHHDEGRSLELGVGVFLMTGALGGAVAGPTAFVVIEAGHGLFLRPSLAFGESLTSLPPSDVKASTWAAGRFDTCVRVPGLYTRHHGMQLDLCGGTDVGMTAIDSGAGTTLPYWDIGPSINLRGELGGQLAAALRAVGGLDLLRGSFTDTKGSVEQVPIANVRLELAFSWDMR
jgi:hypothetical protein